MIYSLLRPAIFRFEAESAHALSIEVLSSLPIPAEPRPDSILAQQVAGLQFAGPVGLAPGYDKDAEVAGKVMRLGFAFAEVGTLTPRPQAGNPYPRLFRLVEDRAVINRMGFNNRGQEDAALRLTAMRRKPLPGPLGINIGANKDSADRIADYVAGMQAMERFADYITVNISSPNTPGLRALQDRGALEELLNATMAARTGDTPVFLKVAPDLKAADIDDIVEVASTHALDALIISNTTISRPELSSEYADETGGLSGAPLKSLALQRLRDFRKASGGGITLIGVGGIENAADAYARIRAGASLVQIYSALVYEGPGLARRIHSDLAAMLRADGFANIADAVGSE